MTRLRLIPCVSDAAPPRRTAIQEAVLRQLLAAGATDEAERKALADPGMAGLKTGVALELKAQDLVRWKAEGEAGDRAVRYWLTPEGLNEATWLAKAKAAA